MIEALCYEPEGRWFEYREGKLHFFNLSKPSSLTTSLGFTQLLKEMSTR
jgi:hypothetical protein